MNMQAMLKQAQKLQKEMMNTKDEISKMTFTGKSSLVEVTVNGDKKVLSVKINSDSTLETDEIEMLQDMIMIATNDAFEQVDKITESKMGKYTQGMPGLF